MTGRWLWGVVWCFGFFIGCGGDDEFSSSDPGVQSCTPGTSVTCLGTGQCSGVQVCSPDGKGYGACDCGSGTGGSAGSGSGGAGGASGSGSGGTGGGTGGSSGSGGGGSGGVAGSSGSGGGVGFALYTGGNGMGSRIQRVDRTSGAFVGSPVDVSSGGQARTLAVLSDTDIRVLYNLQAGKVRLQRFDASLSPITSSALELPTHIGYAFGHLTDQAGFLVWRTDPNIVPAKHPIWKLDGSDAHSGDIAEVPAPAAGFVPVSLTRAPSNEMRLLWADSAGTFLCQVISLDSTGNPKGTRDVPFASGAVCRAYVFDRGLVRISYGNDLTGEASVCNFSAEPASSALLPATQGFSANQCLTLSTNSGDIFRGYFAPPN